MALSARWNQVPRASFSVSTVMLRFCAHPPAHSTPTLFQSGARMPPLTPSHQTWPNASASSNCLFHTPSPSPPGPMCPVPLIRPSSRPSFPSVDQTSSAPQYPSPPYPPKNPPPQLSSPPHPLACPLSLPSVSHCHQFFFPSCPSRCPNPHEITSQLVLLRTTPCFQLPPFPHVTHRPSYHVQIPLQWMHLQPHRMISFVRQRNTNDAADFPMPQIFI